MKTTCVATIRAYEIKAELGGGFRGVYAPVSGEAVKSDVLPSMDAARFFAQNAGFERHPNASRAVIGRSGGSNYRANLWETV